MHAKAHSDGNIFHRLPLPMHLLLLFLNAKQTINLYIGVSEFPLKVYDYSFNLVKILLKKTNLNKNIQFSH